MRRAGKNKVHASASINNTPSAKRQINAAADRLQSAGVLQHSGRIEPKAREGIGRLSKECAQITHGSKRSHHFDLFREDNVRSGCWPLLLFDGSGAKRAIGTGRGKIKTGR